MECFANQVYPLPNSEMCVQIPRDWSLLHICIVQVCLSCVFLLSGNKGHFANWNDLPMGLPEKESRGIVEARGSHMGSPRTALFCLSHNFSSLLLWSTFANIKKANKYVKFQCPWKRDYPVMLSSHYCMAKIGWSSRCPALSCQTCSFSPLPTMPQCLLNAETDRGAAVIRSLTLGRFTFPSPLLAPQALETQPFAQSWWQLPLTVKAVSCVPTFTICEEAGVGSSCPFSRWQNQRSKLSRLHGITQQI